MREGIKQSGRGAVRALRSALLAGVVLLLSACGAVISTTLTVNEDGSGVRTITATLSASDIADHVTGGVAAIEGAITASLPSAMTYEGRTEGPEGESVFTFTVPFEDPEDYQEKVVSILGAGGVVDLDAGTRIVLADSVFRQGLEVEENFTSQDLLAWLVNSLVETGAVPADSSSNASEIGTTAVTVGGVAFETTAAIDFTSMKDFGVRGLSVETRGLEGESFVRSISYDLAREAYSRSPEGYDAFFDAATPEGGELTEPGEAGTTWVVTFPEGTSADVAAWTDVALASSTTEFGVEHAVSRDQAGVLTTTVVDAVDCSAICAEDVFATSHLVTPAGWSSSTLYAGEPGDGGDRWDASGVAGPVVFEHAVPFESVVVEASLPESGDGTVTVALTLTAANHAAAGEQLVEALRPTSTYGTLAVDEADDVVTYRVELTGDTATGELDAALADYLPGSRLAVYPLPGGAFTRSYGADLDLVLRPEWTQGGAAAAPTYVVTLPGVDIDGTSVLPQGSQVEGGTVSASPGAEPATFGLQGTGPKVAALVVVIGVGLVVLAGLAGGAWWFLRRRRPVPDPDTQVLPAVPPPPAPPRVGG